MISFGDNAASKNKIINRIIKHQLLARVTDIKIELFG